MDLDHDLAIKVPVDLIIKEFECPVCFGTLTDAYSTKCGHVFCKLCIEECLNRRHECPNCKKESFLQDTSPNYTLDKIIRNPLLRHSCGRKRKSSQRILRKPMQHSQAAKLKIHKPNRINIHPEHEANFP